MAKKAKPLEKILAGSKNIRFDEFTALLEAFGFELKRISGSHHVFRHPDVPDVFSVQPDQNKQTKPYQIKKLLKMVEEYRLNLEDDE
jgi:predicted RNA binding protein YcfA (HicA-like mRNA interferase family)